MTTHTSENFQRRRRHSLLLMCLIALFGLTTASAESPSPTCVEPIQWQSMMQELRSLRIELLQEKLQRTDGFLAVLQQQLQAAQADRTRAGQMEQARNEQLAELGQQLLQPGLSPQDLSEIEKQRSLVISTAPRVAELDAQAGRREAELREQLRVQQEFRHQLTQTLHALMGVASSTR